MIGRRCVIAAFLCLGVALCPLSPREAEAQADAEILQRLQREIDALRERLDQAEAQRREDARKIRELQAEIDLLKLRADASPPPPVTAEVPQRPNVFNPRLTVFGNALGRVDDRPVELEDGDRIDDRFNLRETEIDLRAAIDPYADGVLIVALESEVPGEFDVGVEEGYALIKDFPFLTEPPLGLRIKAGRFRPEFGRVNRLHTHDLPQSTRPLAVVEFLGDEGFVASGASARMFLPSLLDEESAWELTLQYVTGGDIAMAEDGTNDPAGLGNLRWSRTFADEHFGDVSGIVYYGKSDADGDRSVVTYSLDALYKWKPLRGGEWRSFVLGGQVFFSDREFNEEVVAGVDGEPRLRGRTASPLGAFLFGQYQWSRRVFTGLRGDYTQSIDDDDIETWAIQPYVSYYFSEFLRLRLGWEHHWSDLSAVDDLDSLLAELNVVFGSHPPEPFWVNR